MDALSLNVISKLSKWSLLDDELHQICSQVKNFTKTVFYDLNAEMNHNHDIHGESNAWNFTKYQPTPPPKSTPSIITPQTPLSMHSPHTM